MLRGPADAVPAASPRERPTVAIVGSGAGGTLFAVQLLHAATAARTSVRAVLIDRREQGGGVAYSTRDPRHRLNVTASRMSAFPSLPSHFVDWRARLGYGNAPGTYASRTEYGRYLADVLAESCRRAAPAVSLERLVAEVVAVEPTGDRVRLELADGRAVAADLAVLALGNLGAAAPPGCEAVSAHPGFVRDPWVPGELERIVDVAADAVLLIGSGLTMVDVALSLSRSRPSTRFIAMSRNGLLPRAHLPGRLAPTPAPTRVDPHISFPELVDRTLAEAASGNPRWHQLVDGLRPVTQAHWRRLSFEERAAFMATRHRAWSAHRHRMAPEVAGSVARLLADGRLELHRGAPELEIAPRGQLLLNLPGGERVALSLAVNCTGPALDPALSTDPLVRQLLAAQHVRPHPLGIGFDTAPGGAFRGPDGAPQSRLFTLGPPRIGELYETTAIPEISEQALELATRLTWRLAGESDAERVRVHTA